MVELIKFYLLLGMMPAFVFVTSSDHSFSPQFTACWFVILFFACGLRVMARIGQAKEYEFPKAEVVRYHVPFNHLVVLGVDKLKKYVPPQRRNP